MGVLVALAGAQAGGFVGLVVAEVTAQAVMAQAVQAKVAAADPAGPRHGVRMLSAQWQAPP